MLSLLQGGWHLCKRGEGRGKGARSSPSGSNGGNPESTTANFQALVEQSVDMICQVTQLADGGMRYDYVSPSSEEIVGWTSEEMKFLKHADIYPPASLATIREAGKKLMLGAPSTVVAVEAIRKDGAHIWVENRVRTISDDGRGNRTVVVCMRDITSRKLLQDQLTSLVLVDALTGIGNRRAFDAVLDREWQRAVEQGSSLSLMLIDVDSFKRINDKFGHQVGDECIRRVAHKLTQLVDPPESFVARYGGDEMAVLLPGIDQAKAHDLGNGLCRSIAASTLLPAANALNAPPITISCGVSTARMGQDGLPDFGKTHLPAELIAAADRALYAAKIQGRNRAAVADLA